MTIYFSSDFHFNHRNIAGPAISKWKSGYRNFSSIDEMNETILENLNSKVCPTDELYFLGDFAFGDKAQIPLLRSKIRCDNIFFIWGNHDEAIKRNYRNLFSWCRDYYELHYKGILFCLFHYAIGSWNEMHHGSINCFGHSHGTYPAQGRQLDVGVDPNNFSPLSIDEIIEKMYAVSPLGFDHHIYKGK